jgi:hypothetical protein
MWHDRKGFTMAALAAEKSVAPVAAQTLETTVFLTPERVSRMLAERRIFQIVKFRTNCSDCVPNL